MNSQPTMNSYRQGITFPTMNIDSGKSRAYVIAGIMILSLFAFEMFNFDTTRFALNSLLGEEQFLWFQWATILAIAFCSIDFAGLVRLFTPQRGADEPKEVWYLMGAWLLGATMNAVMTWWAVSLTLLNHDFGNEVLSREKLLLYVPIFVAVLVWLTRILFIGAFSMAGEHLFDLHGEQKQKQQQSPAPQPAQMTANTPSPMRAAPRMAARPSTRAPQPAYASTVTPIETVVPQPRQPRTAAQPKPAAQPRPTVQARPTAHTRPSTTPPPPAVKKVPKVQSNKSRVRQRPPMPTGGVRRTPVKSYQAKQR